MRACNLAPRALRAAYDEVAHLLHAAIVRVVDDVVELRLDNWRRSGTEGAPEQISSGLLARARAFARLARTARAPSAGPRVPCVPRVLLMRACVRVRWSAEGHATGDGECEEQRRDDIHHDRERTLGVIGGMDLRIEASDHANAPQRTRSVLLH